MEQQTRIDILRHGQCEGGNIFRGATDVPLTELGFQQMEKSASLINDGWDKIISSNLTRCRFFSEQLSNKVNTPIEINSEWREISFGVWEGRSIQKLWDDHDSGIAKWSHDPTSFTPEKGEALLDAQARIKAAYHQLVIENQGKRILLVTHGGVLRILLGLVCHTPLPKINSYEIPYACLSRITLFHSEHKTITQLSFHNLSSV